MALFKPRANLFARLSLLLLLLGTVGFLVGAYFYGRASYATGESLAPPQPVPFSHAHHVGGLGIDCRYCHAAVEESDTAGMPPTSTCMNCHSELWTDAEVLRPVRESWRSGRPLAWSRVYDLPDFVFFDHSIHVAKGVSCVECHGRIDRQPLTRQAVALTMEFCLDCHRDPASRLRPREAVFDMGWEPPDDREPFGEALMKAYDIRPEELTNCTICHR
jgi:hypothetical protein